MSVTKEQVLKIAEVTRIDLSDEQIEKLLPKLNSVISEIKKLDEVDTEGVEPIAQITGLKNIMEEDVVRAFADPAALVQCSPLAEGGFVKVMKSL